MDLYEIKKKHPAVFWSIVAPFMYVATGVITIVALSVVMFVIIMVAGIFI